MITSECSSKHLMSHNRTAHSCSQFLPWTVSQILSNIPTAYNYNAATFFYLLHQSHAVLYNVPSFSTVRNRNCLRQIAWSLLARGWRELQTFFYIFVNRSCVDTR